MRHSIVCLGVFLLLLGGCGGGGGTTPVPTGAPQVSAVSPSSEDALGMQGAMVTFHATASGVVTGWQWKFGGGADPNESTAARPQVALGAPGTYHGTVIAMNQAGSSPTVQFAFTVAPPPSAPRITSVTPSGASGVTGDPAVFSATVVGHPPYLWSWDFGSGASPNSSGIATPQVTLAAPGGYTGTLTVSDVNGVSEPFHFEIGVVADTRDPLVTAVDLPDPTHEATKVTFNPHASGEGPGLWNWDFGGGAVPNTSTKLNPTVLLDAPGSYEGTVQITGAPRGDSPVFHFSYVVTDPLPGTWTGYSVPDTNIGGDVLGVTLSGGRPVVLYGSNKYPDYGQASLARALTAAPQSAADWLVFPLDLSPDASSGSYTNLVSVGGHLAFGIWESFPDPDPGCHGDCGYQGGELKIAKTLEPLKSTDFQQDSSQLDIPQQLDVINGRLQGVFLFPSDLYAYYAQSTSDTPWSQPQWQTGDFPGGELGSVGSLPASINTYHDTDGQYKLVLNLSKLAIPIHFSDWAVQSLDSSTTAFSVGRFSEIDGHPVFLAYNNGAQIWRATVPSPTTAGDWQSSLIDPLGSEAQVLVDNNRLVVCMLHRPSGPIIGRAGTLSPSGPADWTFDPIDPASTGGVPGIYTDPSGVHVAYVRAETTGIRIANSPPGW